MNASSLRPENLGQARLGFASLEVSPRFPAAALAGREVEAHPDKRQDGVDGADKPGAQFGESVAAEFQENDTRQPKGPDLERDDGFGIVDNTGRYRIGLDEIAQIQRQEREHQVEHAYNPDQDNQQNHAMSPHG